VSVFEFIDYKKFIQVQIKSNATSRGYQSELATVARCQKSFFSQMLRSELHLTRDHAAELCRFWSCDDQETEYFLTLVDQARAGSPALHKFLSKKLKSLKEANSKLSRSMTEKQFTDTEVQSTYYSSWYWCAIHIALMIPAFQTPSALAERLSLPTDLVRNSLVRLEKMGLVTQAHGKWSIKRADLHLQEDSPMTELNHTHWRNRAILDVQKKNQDSLHYSSVFSVSKKDAEKIRALLMDAILEGRKKILDSADEELFCLNADFFVV